MLASAIAKRSRLSAPRRLAVAASDSKLRSACGSNSVHRIFASPGFCAAAWVVWNRSSIAGSGARMSTSPALARLAGGSIRDRTTMHPAWATAGDGRSAPNPTGRTVSTPTEVGERAGQNVVARNELSGAALANLVDLAHTPDEHQQP